ncbi:MarR family winged helix-turn-helix transcriptional regulator [Povalibacter sp.]|uniref:MarR family winged helix-turn-helix transcriptional regulator n=1 Tax=Povalibacter sp. TaxID=1962978 RepID=UPI002F42AA6F
MDPLKNVGFLLKDVTRRFTVRFEQHAREISLTLVQCKLLLQLEKNEGVSQARLAELTDVEPMMMVRMLDRMEADKLLERRDDPSDRRARRLYLTSKAKPLLEEVDRIAQLTRAEIFAGIGKVEREQFMRVLERVHENACALSAPEAAAPPQTTDPSPARRIRGASRAATAK